MGTGLNVNFDTIADGDGDRVSGGIQQSRCQSLGRRVQDQTKEKTFRLNQDLDIEIRSAATGTFAGTFDGDGHVIKINRLDITDRTSGTETQAIRN